MASKTASKKKTTKKSPAKKPPRMSSSAARAEGAARTKQALAAAKATADANLARLGAEADAGSPASPATPPRAGKGGAGTTQDGTPTPKRPSGLDLAAKVLADAGEPLAAKAIAERAIAAGWSTSGKTPHATLYSAMIREIAGKGEAARFRKTDRGLFVAGAKT